MSQEVATTKAGNGTRTLIFWYDSVAKATFDSDALWRMGFKGKFFADPDTLIARLRETIEQKRHVRVVTRNGNQVADVDNILRSEGQIFIRRVRATGIQIPILVYCGSGSLPFARKWITEEGFADVCATSRQDVLEMYLTDPMKAFGMLTPPAPLPAQAPVGTPTETPAGTPAGTPATGTSAPEPFAQASPRRRGP